MLVILLFTSFILLFWELIDNDTNTKTYQISVIVSGKSDESLMILKEGTEQAATDLNANIRFIFLSQEHDVQEQIELIKRESKNNVDAILISPVENEEVVATIEEVNKKVPVIVIQSSLKIKSNINRVTCDEYFLGQQLAKEALSNIDDGGVLIINGDSTTTAGEERHNGIASVMDENDRSYYKYDINDYNKSIVYYDIEKLIVDKNVQAVICLDIKSSEYVGEYKKILLDNDYNKEFSVYGVGSTNKIISFLEEGIINGTAIQNEFNIGYLAVENAIRIKINKKYKEQKLKSTVVTSENMYWGENERILFQFIR